MTLFDILDLQSEQRDKQGQRPKGGRKGEREEGKGGLERQ